MKETLHKLVELSQLDAQIHAVERQLHLYPKMLADLGAKEAASKKKIKDAEERFQHSREARRKVELEVKAFRDQINKYLAQQAQVKTNKEYEAITHEIDGVKTKIDDLDFKGLEALEEEERSDKERQETLRLLQALEKDNGAERERISKQTAEKKSRLQQLQSERAVKFAEIPEDFQEIYDLLNDRYPGEAVAQVREDACSGCGLNLIKQLAIDVRRGDTLVRCQSCMRILYDPVALNS